jgi:hypothetical protein
MVLGDGAFPSFPFPLNTICSLLFFGTTDAGAGETGSKLDPRSVSGRRVAVVSWSSHTYCAKWQINQPQLIGDSTVNESNSIIE